MEPTNSILIIEDDAASVFLTRRLLSGMDSSFRILTAQNGQEALEMLREAKEKAKLPQLILLDINMPVMDGFEFLEELQQSADLSSTPLTIVLLTSSTRSAV